MANGVKEPWEEYWRKGKCPHCGQEGYMHFAGGKVEHVEIERDKSLVHVFLKKGYKKLPLPPVVE